MYETDMVSKVESENLHTKKDKIDVALNLPIVASYNMRSLFPKIQNFTTDILERNIDVAFVTEIWENAENINHQSEIDKMFEVNGLKYISSSRKQNLKGEESFSQKADGKEKVLTKHF